MNEGFSAFVRTVPIIDIISLLLVFIFMYIAWSNAKHDPNEKDDDKRKAGVSVITSQINGAIIAANIILASVGAVLALGLDKSFPKEAASHLINTAAFGCLSVILGIWILGSLSSPSVFHRIDATKKMSIQLACFVQLALVVLATIRFFLALLCIKDSIL